MVKTNAIPKAEPSEKAAEADERLPLRVGILLDHPSPHMVSLLDALAERPGCAAQVIYLGSSNPKRQWPAARGDLPSRVLGGIALSPGFRLNPGLGRALAAARVDVWLVGSCYTSPSTVMAARWLTRRGHAWVYMNEPLRERGRLVQWFKKRFLRHLLRGAAGIVATGKMAQNLYASLMPDRRPTVSVPYFLDLEPFLAIAPKGDVGDVVRFVALGQAVPRKGLDVLLRACEQLPGENWHLTVVGDGPRRRRLEKDFSALLRSGRVSWEPSVAYEGRASAFGGHDVLVLASRWDGWGMVVPEALASGLPVISTDRVVAAHEFVRDGVNGFIVPVNDAARLAGAMSWFLDHRQAIPGMGRAGRVSVANYRAGTGAERLIDFLSAVSGMGRTSSNCYLSDDAHLTWHALTTPARWSQRLAQKSRRWARGTVIGASVAVRANRRDATGNRILVYHLVLPEDRARFEEHLRFLKDHFQLLSLENLVSHAGRDQGASGVAITFDDGFDVLMGPCLEILQKHGVKATFFVPTGHVDLSDDSAKAARFCLRSHYYRNALRPMGPRDVALLSQLGHDIGSHGVSHVSLASMSRFLAERELRVSRARIEAWTGNPPAAFAYPYGHVESSLGDLSCWVREQGYRFGVTLERGKILPQSNHFRLPREHVEGFWSLRDLRFFLSAG